MRDFRPNGDGTWNVEHTFFTLPEAHQGSGGARRMLRSSIEAYDSMKVRRVEVHANIDVGGYSWAKLGFAHDEPKAVRAAISSGLKAKPRSPMLRAAKATADKTSDSDLMHALARTTGPDGADYGKALLIDSDWRGHLDLTDAGHRRRLAGNF